MFPGDDPGMAQASKQAQESFKHFWREVYWERRRIIPGLDFAMIKLPFTDGDLADPDAEVEHMWVNDVEFDGKTIAGALANAPNHLQSVKEGDSVSMPFENLGDWMMSSNGEVYGGYTVNLMRSRMSVGERRQHDSAWGLDFGDPAHIRVQITREKPEKKSFLGKLFAKGNQVPAAAQGFSDHPMCVNMLEKVEEQLQSNTAIMTDLDERGWPLLHSEALAGNLGIVKLLLKYGADPAAATPDGRTAADLASGIGWPEIADFLKSQTPG